MLPVMANPSPVLPERCGLDPGAEDVDLSVSEGRVGMKNREENKIRVKDKNGRIREKWVKFRKYCFVLC